MNLSLFLNNLLTIGLKLVNEKFKKEVNEMMMSVMMLIGLLLAASHVRERLTVCHPRS